MERLKDKAADAFYYNWQTTLAASLGCASLSVYAYGAFLSTQDAVATKGFCLSQLNQPSISAGVINAFNNSISLGDSGARTQVVLADATGESVYCGFKPSRRGDASSNVKYFRVYSESESALDLTKQ